MTSMHMGRYICQFLLIFFVRALLLLGLICCNFLQVADQFYGILHKYCSKVQVCAVLLMLTQNVYMGCIVSLIAT